MMKKLDLTSSALPVLLVALIFSLSFMLVYSYRKAEERKAEEHKRQEHKRQEQAGNEAFERALKLRRAAFSRCVSEGNEPILTMTRVVCIKRESTAWVQ